jgi:hypothetical protein
MLDLVEGSGKKQNQKTKQPSPAQLKHVRFYVSSSKDIVDWFYSFARDLKPNTKATLNHITLSNGRFGTNMLMRCFVYAYLLLSTRGKLPKNAVFQLNLHHHP